MTDERLNMAREAYEKVPMYYNLAEQKGISVSELSFEEIPVVDKSYYAQAGMSSLSSDCIADYLAKKLIWMRTSGSTGKCSEVFWRKKDYNASLMELWMLRKKYYGISAREKMVHFCPLEGTGKTCVESRYTLAVARESLTDGTLKQSYEKILAYDPVWMVLQPSAAMLLCGIAEYLGRKPGSLRYIEFTGEYLEAEVVRRVRSVFGCMTANQYGTKEVNSIAYECPAGSLHLMAGNVYAEVIGQDAQGKGQICITSLHNHAMPFIRFNIEDRGMIHKNVTCSCGRCSDLLELQAGRSNDWIQNADGSRTHADALIRTMRMLNDRLEGGIRQYKILQTAYDCFVVYLILEEEELYEEVADYLSVEFADRLDRTVEVEVILMDELIPNGRTGKLASFVSCIPINQEE